MSVEKLKRRTPEQILGRFIKYLEVFGLEDAVARGDSIAVVGAGDNVFAAGVEEYNIISGHKPLTPFIVGLEPMEQSYHALHPNIINHDARSIGMPDDLFDATVSLDGVPKYFFIWLSSKEQKKEMLEREGEKRLYSYDIINEVLEGENYETVQKVVNATTTALSEMIRITKPGGPVRVHPIFSKIVMDGEDMFSLSRQEVLDKYGGEAFLMKTVLSTLSKIYPGLEVKTFKEMADPDRDGTFSFGMEFIKRTSSSTATVEKS